MKHFRLLVPAILALLVSSCASQKRAWYLQDANPFTPEQIAESGQIRIKPLDRLTIVVNSKDPELAVPFNSSTSLSSVTGRSTAREKPAANWRSSSPTRSSRAGISTTRRSTCSSPT